MKMILKIFFFLMINFFGICLIYGQKPVIKSFNPTSGTLGTRVNISGSNFTGVTSIKFGNTEASSFTVNSDSTLQAIVGNGSTGIIKVTNNNGSDTSINNFIFSNIILKPIVTTFTPVSGSIGTKVNISGLNFTGTTSVKFGNIEASSFILNSDSTIQATVDSGSSGVIRVTNIAGSDTSKNNFTFIPNIIKPILNSFTPSSGTVGTRVLISGHNFKGVTSIKFGNTEASSFTVNNDSTIQATVGNGSTGIIKVTNSAGSDSSKTTFTFISNISKPVFNSFTPNIGMIGSQVYLSGLNFTGVTSVKFGNTEALSFTVKNDSTIQATVNNGSTGIIKVTNSAGSDTSKSIFLYLDTTILQNNIYKATNRGKEFWVGYGSHASMYTADGSTILSGGLQDMVLYFTSDRDANVTVSIPASGTGWTKTYKVISGQVTVSDTIPKTGESDAKLSFEGKSNKGIYIVSDVEISAYVHIYNSAISGACLLYPVANFGNQYYVLNYSQVSNQKYSYSFAYTIATEDSTIVEITPSANTLNKLKNDTIRVLLNRGEVYNILGKSSTIASAGQYIGEDLTGTKFRVINSTNTNQKRIAVFSGSGKLTLSCSNTQSPNKSADNLIQQSFPVTAWGKRFITVPTKDMPNNYFRIAVSDPTTIVKVDGIILKISDLQNNFFYQIVSNTPKLIESNKPIMVAQYITTANSCGNSEIGGNGDPEMIYLSSIEQNVNNITIYSTPNARITSHYINLIIAKNGLKTLNIDGINPIGAIKHPSDSNYYYFQLSVNAGSHTIYSDSGFNAIIYGYGNAESYGYNAGLSRMDLSVPEIFENVIASSTPSIDIKYFSDDNRKIYIYKDTVENVSKVYDSLDLAKFNNRANLTINPIDIEKQMNSVRSNPSQSINRYIDTKNQIFNKAIYYRVNSTNSENIQSNLSNKIKTIIFSSPNILFPNNNDRKIDTSTILKWNKIPNGLLYQIQLSSDSNFQNRIFDFIIKDTIYNKNTLKDNSTYFWRVRVIDSTHISSWSSNYKFQTNITPPYLNTLKIRDNKVKLSWTNKSSGDIRFYKIFRSTELDNYIKIDSIPGNILFFTDTITNGITYKYKINTGNLENIESEFSNIEKIECPTNKPTFNTSKFSICSGDSIKLSITNVNKGDTLKWYFGTKSDLTNVANKTFTDSTKLYVTRTDSVGCVISSDTIQIKKFVIPNPPSLSRDSDNNLVANTNGISWYKDGIKIADTTQKIKPTSNGNYTATTTQNGCTSSASANYYYLTSAVANLSGDEYFKVSPNPTRGDIYLNYNIRSTKDVYINVIDINGRTIVNNRKVNSGSKLNLGSSMKGNYIIQVKDKAGKLLTTEKLIKN